MPSNLLTADTMFPDLEGKRTDEKFDVLTNYLYMLLEQLRYTLGNLGIDNFNSDEFLKIGKTITDPIYAQLEDDEGNIALLQVTAQGLASRVSDAEGDISTLAQTATSLTSQISDANGNISALQQTAQGLASRITDAEGNISTLQQTSSGLLSRMTSAEGNISTLLQTVDGFGLSVSNGSSSSTLYLTSSGVRIDSAVISFTGMVTFSDLETEGTTLIHGGNIDTDTLQVSDLYGQYVYLRNSSGTVRGRISISGASTANTAVDLESYGALRLTADSGDVFAQSGNGAYVQLSSEVILGGGDTRPNQNDTWSCGTSAQKWSDVYSTNGTIQTSDRNLKHDIEDLPGKYLDMLLSLHPRRYKMNNGTSDRYHVGYIAQEVEEAMEKFGIDSLEFAGFVKDVDEDGNEIYLLRYEEFIAIHTLAVQKIYQRLENAGI